ncbi:hypothetical protein ACVIIW_006236 [Bradyrhizobium sp. USDA 4449]
MNLFVGAAALAGAAIPRRSEAGPSPTVSAVSLPPAHPDAALFDLVDKCVAAEKRLLNADIALDQLERPLPPEVLRIRPRDLELGCKPWELAQEFWTAPCDIAQWRQVDKWQTKIQQRIPATEELSTRGQEIVEAFDSWHERRPRGYVKLDRERKRAERAWRIANRAVCATPAATLEGLRAKLRCVEIEGGLDDLSVGEPIIVSLLYDLQRISES